jgi:4-amino-4-deoxy-L-arabinose transferase-like glycosyltransferase
VVLVAGLAITLRAARTDRFRASLLRWGGWLLVTGVVFSFMKGIFHEYYTVALAPAIAALAGVGARELWVRRGSPAGLTGLAVAVAATGGWGFVLLNRTPSWYPALRWVLIAVTLPAVGALLIPGRRLRRLTVAGAVAAAVTGLFGSAAYALPTISAGQGGPIPAAGPSTGRGGLPGGRPLPAGLELPEGVQLPGMAGGGMPGDAGQVSAELAALLQSTRTTWAAATVTTSEAAGLELASGRPVMGIGGFTGSDPAPTLDRFKKYVAEGKVRWFVTSRGNGGGGMPGGFNPSAGTGEPGAGSTAGSTPGGGGPFGGAGPMGGGSGTASEITRWVQDNFTATTVGGQTVYDLAKAKS